MGTQPSTAPPLPACGPEDRRNKGLRTLPSSSSQHLALSHAASYREAQQRLPRQTEQLLSSVPTNTERAVKGRSNAEWMGTVATERELRGVAGSCPCEAPCHTAARYTDTAWTLLAKTELWDLWTSLNLERLSCLIPAVHTGESGGKHSMGACGSYHVTLISHNQQ